MSGPDELRTVGAELRTVRELLRSARLTDLDSCRPHLERAVAGLRMLETRLTDSRLGAPEARCAIEVQLSEARGQLADIRLLLNAAARFHQGWAATLFDAAGYDAAGYDAAGHDKGRAMAPSEPPRRLSLHG